MLVSSEAANRNKRISVKKQREYGGRLKRRRRKEIPTFIPSHQNELYTFAHLLNRKADNAGNKLQCWRQCRASRQPDQHAERLINTDSQDYYRKEQQMAWE